MSKKTIPQRCYICGDQFDYNNQLPTCKTHGILWPLVRNAASAETLTLNEKGEVLLVKRAIDPMKGTWALPGGFSDYGEKPAATAIRETKEETGWTVELGRVLGVYLDSFPGDKHSEHRWVVSFLARPVEHNDVLDDETAEYGWFKSDELPDNMIPVQLNRFDDLRKLDLS